jgi:putative transposase
MDVPKFRALFRSALAPEVIDMIRNATNGNYSLGDERFKKEVEKALGVTGVSGIANAILANPRKISQLRHQDS